MSTLLKSIARARKEYCKTKPGSEEQRIAFENWSKLSFEEIKGAATVSEAYAAYIHAPFRGDALDAARDKWNELSLKEAEEADTMALADWSTLVGALFPATDAVKVSTVTCGSFSIRMGVLVLSIFESRPRPKEPNATRTIISPKNRSSGRVRSCGKLKPPTPLIFSFKSSILITIVINQAIIGILYHGTSKSRRIRQKLN